MEAERGSTKAGVAAVVFRWSPWACGVVFFALDILTLSSGSYPGESARLTAEALGCDVTLSPAHPVWRLLVALWRRLPTPLSPVEHLNLLGAVCGASAVGFLCLGLSRWFRSLIGRKVLTPPQTDLVAASAGALGAVVLGGSTAVWSLSVRLHYLSFDLLWAVLCLGLLWAYQQREGVWRGYLLALLCGAGAAESTLVMAVSAVLAAIVFVGLLLRRKVLLRHVFGLAAAGLTGACSVYVLAVLRFFAAHRPDSREVVEVRDVMFQLWREQLRELASCVPHAGWLYALLLAVPWVLVLTLGKRWLVGSERPARLVVHALLAVLTLLVLCEAPFLPWRALVLEGRVPVFEMLLAATLAGYAAVGLSLNLLTVLSDAKCRHRRSSNTERWLPQALVGAAFLLAVLSLVVRNGGRADGRRGMFADAYARVVLDQLGDRRWLVSDGLLDANLAVCAECAGRALHLVSLAEKSGSRRLARVRQAIATEPDLHPFCVPLRNAASLGAVPLVREWVRTDPRAGSRLALNAVPILWRSADWQPRPEGLFFSAVTNLAELSQEDLPAANRRVWERVASLVQDTGYDDALDALRQQLRRRLSMAAVELGVTLEDLSRPEAAYQSYDRALAFEPGNLSAKLNRLRLSQRGIHSEGAFDSDVQAVAALTKEKRKPVLGQVVLLYGTVRDPEALASAAACWMRLGEPCLAATALRRAIGLASGAVRDRLLEAEATFCFTVGDTVGGEAVCQRLLRSDPANVRAFLGLITAASGRGDRAATAAWIEKARRGGVPKAALDAIEPNLAAASGRLDEAERLLLARCDRDPKDQASLSLLVTVMVRQGRLGEAERVMLPRIRALGRDAVPSYFKARAQIAKAKGRAFFAEARSDLLTAILFHPGEWLLLADALELDRLLHDAKAVELDACELLRRSPDHPAANRALGLFLLACGDLEDAEYRLRRSAAADPANPETWNELAETLRRRGSPAAAEDAVRKALALAPGSANAWDTLANVMLDAGLLPGAREASDRACGLNPRDSRLVLTAARVRTRIGQPAEARALMGKLVRDRLPTDGVILFDRLTAELAGREADGNGKKR